ncbi:uncharacterized protein DS421_18g619170 [Arachis hypogaea]|nr:uncharacterized protein DS421_18g619170 [Arachis hypogaea]
MARRMPRKVVVGLTGLTKVRRRRLRSLLKMPRGTQVWRRRFFLGRRIWGLVMTTCRSLATRRRESGTRGGLSVMEKNFDAGGFIESQLLPGTKEFFQDADLAGQARWIYRSLLRAAAIAKKVEPVLGNIHVLEGKLRNSQKDLTDSRSRKDCLKTKLTEREEKAEEDAKEINRLVERTFTLMKNLNTSCAEIAAAEKKDKDLERN